nr:unnamed protein product [Callosobruchus analis]
MLAFKARNPKKILGALNYVQSYLRLSRSMSPVAQRRKLKLT